MAQQDIEIPGYDLQRELGSGGMAHVYLAVQRSLNRKVAIKAMRHKEGSDDREERRFLLEAQTLAKLRHTNIVGVYDIVESADLNYIVMEFLEGGSLVDRMRTGWLTLSELIGIIAQLAGCLQHAHDAGIVHRDLKPANILFRDSKTPVLADFGIALIDHGESNRITETGMAIGTPTYMSPEQATGDRVDGRSDQYSLGVLFYELLTKKPPFEGESPMQVAYAHVHTPPARLPLDLAFAQPLMDKMLAKKPEDRYPDMKTFGRELKNAILGSSVLQRRMQIQPGQDISEQLKGIGFNETQLQSGPKVIPAMSAELPPGIMVHKILEGSELQLEAIQERRRVTRTEEKKKPWGLIIGVALVVLAIGAWLAKDFIL